MIETKSAAVAVTLATLRGHQSAESSHELYGCRIQRQGAGNTSGEVAHGVDCGRVLATVDRQREPVRMWLYTAYAEPPWEWVGDDMFFGLHEHVVSHCRPQMRCTGSRAEDLAMLAIHDMRQRRVRGESLPGAEYTRKLGLDRSAWRRIDGDVRALLNEVDGLDAEGLKAVASVIRRTADDDAA